MNKIQELQTKIQTLQSQITQKQAQILDYTTNKTYQKTETFQRPCGHAGCMQKGMYCTPYETRTYNAKQKELTNTQNALKSLQNQLQATQAQLDSLLQAQLEKAQAKLNALLARCSTPPPPSTDLVAIKRVLDSLASLQSSLSAIKSKI